MAQNDYMQIFLFEYKNKFYKAIINHTRKTYIVYSPDGKLFLEKSNLTKMSIKKIEKEVIEWMKGKSEIIGCY